MRRLPSQAPLRRLKTNVRKLLEEELAAEIEDWGASRIDGVRAEIERFRRHYRELREVGADHQWAYPTTQNGLIAYALAYYPYYVELLSEALSRVEFEVDRDWHLAPAGIRAEAPVRFAFVGCGPGPEVYGLLRYVSKLAYDGEHREAIRPNLSVELFEPAARSWRWLADTLTTSLISRGTWLDDHIERENIRISWSEDRPGVPKLRLPGLFDIVIVQFVLNEVGDDDRSVWIKRVVQENLADGGLLIVVDTDPSVHAGLGDDFRRVCVNLHWTEDGERQLDRKTSELIFTDAGDSVEKRRVRSAVSVMERGREAAFIEPKSQSVLAGAARPPSAATSRGGPARARSRPDRSGGQARSRDSRKSGRRCPLRGG